jgi:predicted metal-dependent hydrolase
MNAPQHLTVRGRQMQFQWVISDRRTTLGIEVHPHPVEGARLVVRAPQELGWPEIARRIERRANWIVRQADELDQYVPGPQPRQYLPGETFNLLGRQLQLRLRTGQTWIETKGNDLIVHMPAPADRTAISDVLAKWYHTQAQNVFSARLILWLKHPLLRPETPISLQVRRLKTRWGSLSSSGKMTLNTKLVQRPLQCIDYVIAHELCHHWHPNHGEEFLNLLTDVLPGWEKAKQRLELL